ncbi:MAG: galactokinase [Oscillospiraceae bacterium]|nr:galactokinase [Oscillospiraceae bacterium]
MKLLDTIASGALDESLRTLYGSADHARAERIAAAFAERFPAHVDEAALFSAPGRTEIGGNHTDHHHGRVLCGSVDLDMLACAAPNGTNEIRVFSEGYGETCVSLEDLKPVAAERDSTAALVRGVAAGVAALGHAIAGFDAYVHSTVLAGSGLSSSAAFEVLIGVILNRFFCRDALDAITIAKLSQMAERDYYGKPCGLMDQMGSAVGGAVAIDFCDPANPVVSRPGYDFDASGHALCIIDTGSSHDDLTDDYAAVAEEMRAVAACFGKTVLREVPEELFRANIASVREKCGDRAVLRARHFYSDDRRAALEAEALREGDFARFLALVNESGRSSVCDLQNIWSPKHPNRQSVSLALSLGRELLGGRGAIRVHGGGFAGTVQAFVPEDLLAGFRDGIEAVFGEGKCRILRIRPVGGCQID